MHSGGGQDIGAEASSALLFDQFATVGGFAREFRSGGRIKDGPGALQSQHGAGRDDAPKVFTDFYAEAEGGGFIMKDDVRAERNQCAIERDFPYARARLPAGSELPFFIEFPVVGQHCFGNQRQNPSSLHHGGGIIQGVSVQERQPYHGNCPGPFCGFRKAAQAIQGRLPQARLEEEVPAGVARDAQLREDDCRSLLRRSLPESCHELVNVVVHVSYAELGDGGSKSVISEHGRSGLEIKPADALFSRSRGQSGRGGGLIPILKAPERLVKPGVGTGAAPARVRGTGTESRGESETEDCDRILAERFFCAMERDWRWQSGAAAFYL